MMDIALVEVCHTIIQRKLPSKLTNSGRFTIHCSIGSLTIGHALYDLGANINLLSLSMMIKLKCGELKQTKMTLKLADRLTTYPYGVLKHFLVIVDVLFPPAYFVILDMPEDSETPLLLGRPFLATCKTLII